MSPHDNLSADTREQLQKLQRQVQDLMNDRVGPALSDAAGRARDFAGRARDTARDYAEQARESSSDGAEAVSARVRDQPLMAVAVAAGVGYLLGRITR